MINPGQEEVVRGVILQLLLTDADHTLSDSTLRLMLQHAGWNITMNEVRSQLQYLSGKGKELIDYWKHNNVLYMVKLLPNGRDVLEGRLDVPGVMCPYCGD